MLNLLRRLWKDEEGQGMVEYGLILALISIVVIFFLTGIGTRIRDVFEDIRDALPGGS